MPAPLARHRFAPSTSTASVVEALVVVEREGDAPHVAVPRPEIEIVVRIGPAVPGGVDAYAFGARQRVRRKRVQGVRRAVSARLGLGTPQAVLGVPASAVAGEIVALEDLWGSRAVRRLYERIATARDASEAASALDRAIAEQLPITAAAPSSVTLALAAAARLRTPTGVIANVGEVAEGLGVSERHLRRVFRDAFGLAPKAFARLARFDSALRAAARRPAPETWASIAVGAGYYDQAHLIAEFRAIADATPRALLGELRASSW